MKCRNSTCPFFEIRADKGLSAESKHRCAVFDALQNVEFKSGEVLFLQGQPSSSLYSLSKGVVKICSNSAEGDEHIVGLSSPDNLLLGLQSINEDRYAYTGIAETVVRACKINHRALLSHLEDKPGLAMRLVGAMSAQLAHSRALMEVMGHHCAAAKIASFVLLMTPKSEQGNCSFRMPFSRLEVANILGLSEETVCRIMANMYRSGAIYAPRGRIEIRDWKQLNVISEGNHATHLAH